MKYSQLMYPIGLLAMLIGSHPLLGDEAFVVLEYNSSATAKGTSGFGYLVQPGDTLAGIVAKHYGRAANHKDVFKQIVAQNPRAFVGNNPNRLISGATLNLSGSGYTSGNSGDEIYFF